jgi:coenzyme F420 hydrogenase subunit gamma
LDKPSTLIYDLGGCEGCPLSILRILPQLTKLFNVFSKHIGEVDLYRKYDYAVVTGPICLDSSRHVEALKKIRENSNVLIAYGSCASVGGIILYARGGQEPRPEHRIYAPISRVVKVDYAIPGCPPAPQMLLSLINCIQKGKGYFLDLFKAVAHYPKLSGFDLMDEVVLNGLCVGCGACVLSCPTNALQMIDNRPDLIPEKCIRCGTCTVRCPRFSQLLIQRFKLSKKEEILLKT